VNRGASNVTKFRHSHGLRITISVICVIGGEERLTMAPTSQLLHIINMVYIALDIRQGVYSCQALRWRSCSSPARRGRQREYAQSAARRPRWSWLSPLNGCVSPLAAASPAG